VNIRRLAAVDLHGAAGTTARRRLILAEFVTGATVGVGLGVVVALTASNVAWRLLGVWIAGACANYVPLAMHAVALCRGDALRKELAGADVRGELRRYTRTQFWVAVPLLFVVLDLRASVSRRDG
jgi:hypothetical protein